MPLNFRFLSQFKAGLRQHFFLRQGVSFKWKWNKTTIVDQKIGGDSDVDLKNFGFCLFSVFISLTVQYAYKEVFIV